MALLELAVHHRTDDLNHFPDLCHSRFSFDPRRARSAPTGWRR
jgi:hypothetical protein